MAVKETKTTITTSTDSNTATSTTARPKIVCNAPGVKSHILSNIQRTQKGFCRFYEKEITKDYDIVSRGKKPKKYYHKKCAKILNIV
jgi:hypothetical protein